MMDMEPPRQELSLDESIKEVMQTLPPPIRNYLAQGKYTAVAKGLMVKYRLHIDQAAIAEREIMLLLMGIENPDEFTKSLAEDAKLDQRTINGIVQDVNAQIFVPLREEMRRGPVVVPQLAKSAAASAPPRPPQTLPVAPKYAPLPKFPHLLQNKLPDKKLLEDHEEPHIEFHKTAPPPANLPGAIHHPPLNNPQSGLSGDRSTEQNGLAAPKPPIVPPPQPLPPKPKLAVPITKYSSDPYREPVDEK